jgi:hypothetical protein
MASARQVPECKQHGQRVNLDAGSLLPQRGVLAAERQSQRQHPARGAMLGRLGLQHALGETERRQQRQAACRSGEEIQTPQRRPGVELGKEKPEQRKQRLTGRMRQSELDGRHGQLAAIVKREVAHHPQRVQRRRKQCCGPSKSRASKWKPQSGSTWMQGRHDPVTFPRGVRWGQGSACSNTERATHERVKSRAC